jgi:hypothetical protein
VCESGKALSPDVVTAMREIVADHEHYWEGGDPRYGSYACGTCYHDSEYGFPPGVTYCGTMLALARIWRITEDYSLLWDEQHRVLAGTVEQPARELT